MLFKSLKSLTPSLVSAIAFYLSFFLITYSKIVIAEPSPNKSFILASTSSCPSDLTTLTNSLLQDLPDYANRVLKRTQDRHYDVGIDNYIIVAGQPELKPLNLPQISYDSDTSEQPEQIFFTTLERQYNKGRAIERETYHWLFVTPTENGWYMFTIFSRFGDSVAETPPSPPKESSDGVIGQAVSLWLRDCRAGALHSRIRLN